MNASDGVGSRVLWLTAERATTYRDVKPILDANCKICHGRAAGLNLEKLPFVSPRIGD